MPGLDKKGHVSVLFFVAKLAFFIIMMYNNAEQVSLRLFGL